MVIIFMLFSDFCIKILGEVFLFLRNIKLFELWGKYLLKITPMVKEKELFVCICNFLKVWKQIPKLLF